ncbi:MAG: hypothetical protein L6Q75_06615 [Burkholderiaceae bacterium]|nr:hypothetical protein [Burkholderiaceae bacterium]
MFKSLFGELVTPRGRRDDPQIAHDDDKDFASTEVMPEADDEGEAAAPADRHQRDLFVTGSPVQAMRAHFAGSRDEAGSGQRWITLHDPSGMWAGAVLKALSDASGQPIERLHLRDQGSLDSLAIIERTTLPRRMDDTLKVYHAEVGAEAREVDAIPLVLLEQADLGAVVIGPMAPSALDELLATLCAATQSEHWRCPQLLFLLPVGALWIAHKIDALHWPARVHVVMLAEPLTSASAVWNKVLAHWNRVKPAGADSTPAPAPSSAPASARPVGALPSGFVPSGLAPGGLAASPTPASIDETVLVQPPPPPAAAWSQARPATAEAGGMPPAPDPQRALVILRELMLLDGLIFASLVDAETGLVIASEERGPDIDRAAVAATELLRLHRRTLRQMGHTRPNDPVDEILVTAGNRYHILRTLQARPDCFILAVLDKLRSNLAMTRFRIMEAQQVLG